MPKTSRGRGWIAVIVSFATLLVMSGAVAEAPSYQPCKRVSNPYAGSRYEGIDLRRIRALNVPCATARRVARGAHRKALGLTPPSSGIRSFRWRAWSVTGDLRGAVDRYLAKRGGKRVRWVF